MSRIRIAIISDIHAVQEESSSDSYQSLNVKSRREKQDPLNDLLAMIAKEQISVDYLLCGGDVANRANVDAFQTCWHEIQNLGQALSVKGPIMGTIGNHDIDSRLVDKEKDVVGQVKLVTPRYPIDDEGMWMKYWALNHFVWVADGIRVVSVNSCAHHHLGKVELEKGRMSEYDFTQVLRAIQSTDASATGALNILLLHHPPISGPLGDLNTVVPMEGGDRLVRELTSHSQDWVVIHGHIHYPNITYSQTAANGPTVLSCGSFSSKLIDSLNPRVRNQFYILELELSAFGRIMGRGYAWDWNQTVGWSPASKKSGIPHRFGFGHRDVAGVAQKVGAFVTGVHLVKDVVAAVPELELLVPADFDALQDLLTRNFSIEITYNRQDQPFQIAKV